MRSDKAVATEGLYGKDWSTFKSGTSGMQMDPPSRVLSLPLAVAVGKTWNADYEGTTTTGAKLGVKVESKVVAEEKIATPAGEGLQLVG